MSAFYSFVYPDRVSLLTDGAFTDENGILGKIGRKVFIWPRRPLAITARGYPASEVFDVINEIVSFVDAVAAYDDMDSLLAVLESCFTNLRGREKQLNAEFLIAAYSESRGPCHFVVQCHGRWDIPSFQFVSPGEQIGAGPAISLGDLDHLRLTAEDISSSDFPEKHGIEIMTAMRRKVAKVPGAEREMYAVGGLCELTTVTARGAITRTLCRWADPVGEAIDPEKNILLGGRWMV